MTAPGWEGILDKGEKILWQGRPDGRVRVRIGDLFQTVFGVFFLGFAIFWTVMAAFMTSQGGGPPGFRIFFPLFGLPFIAVGAYLVFGRFLWSAYQRRHTWYTLTDKRAFFATDLPVRGRSLKSWRISPGTVIDFRPGPPASIFFAEEVRQGNQGRRYRVPVGFEWIDEGEEVFRLIRGIQREAKT